MSLEYLCFKPTNVRPQRNVTDYGLLLNEDLFCENLDNLVG